MARLEEWSSSAIAIGARAPIATVEQNSAYGLLRRFLSQGTAMIFRPPRRLARLAGGLSAASVMVGILLYVVSGFSRTIDAAQRPTTPGQITARPDEGREPEFPQPKIRDYKPRSTLVVAQHPVPRAKFPVVDIHGHPPALMSSSVVDTVVAALDTINVQVMVNASALRSPSQLQQQVDV